MRFPIPIVSPYMKGYVEYDGRFIFTLKASIDYPADVIAWTAPPPIDSRMAYMGSGLPVPNSSFWEHGPNHGAMRLRHGGGGAVVKIPFEYPTSSYVNGGRMLIPPTIVITLHRRGMPPRYVKIPLPNMIPYRSLTNLPTHPVRSTYHDTRPDTFYE